MTSQQLKRLILPERYQVVISVLASLIIMGVTLGSLIYDKFLGQSILNTPEAQSIYLDNLGRLSDIPIVRTTVIVLFWGGVGLGAYIFYLAVSNALTDTRNDVVIETAYTNKGPFAKVVERVLPQLGAAAALIAFLYIGARVLLPSLLELAAGGILALPQPVAVTQMVGAMFGTALLVYIAWTLGQLMFALE